MLYPQNDLTVISRPSPGTTTLHHNHLIKKHVTSASPESVSPPASTDSTSVCTLHVAHTPNPSNLRCERKSQLTNLGVISRHSPTMLGSLIVMVEQTYAQSGRFMLVYSRGTLTPWCPIGSSRDSPTSLTQRTPSRLKDPKDSIPRVPPEGRDGRAAPCFEPPKCRRPALGRYETSADSRQRTSETSPDRVICGECIWIGGFEQLLWVLLRYFSPGGDVLLFQSRALG